MKTIDDGGARERLRDWLGDTTTTTTTAQEKPRKPKVTSTSTRNDLTVLGYVAALDGNAKAMTEELLPDGRVLARWPHPIFLSPEELLILSGHGDYLLKLPDDFSDEEAPGHKIFTDDRGRATGFEGPRSIWRHYLCHHCEFLDWMERFMDCAVNQYEADNFSRRKRP
jgi:hypothetical protein